MKISEEIELAKQRFADNYPIPNGISDCARYGVNAATGRAHLYSPDANRQDIRDYWIQQLMTFGEKYINCQTLETFKSDILTLKKSMNSRFPGCFMNGKLGYDNEFRIAHAQKSLSIFLKHMWCNNLISVLPPVCPIDGVILKYCGSNDYWTKVNSIKAYERHLEIVEVQRRIDKIESLPEWEVLAFNKNQGSRKKSPKRTSMGMSLESSICSISKGNWFEVMTYYSHNTNGRQLVFADKQFKNTINEHYNAGETLEIQIDNQHIIVKADNPYKYPCFRQSEINKWAKQKEEEGSIHNDQTFTIRARFINNENN